MIAGVEELPEYVKYFLRLIELTRIDGSKGSKDKPFYMGGGKCVGCMS